jgi:UPF0716 protein FxsA
MGTFETFMLVMVTGVVGAWMARAEGFRVLRSWQSALAEGRIPADGVVSGALVLVGGVLLVTPGVLTDMVGFALLFPPTRRLLAALVVRRVERGIQAGSIHVMPGPGIGAPFGSGGFVRPDVIDVKAEVVDGDEG